MKMEIRKQPESSGSNIVPRGDSNPHGFPHHPLKMPLYARGLRFVRYHPNNVVPRVRTKGRDYAASLTTSYPASRQFPKPVSSNMRLP
jgi:hypothetical protein